MFREIQFVVVKPADVVVQKSFDCCVVYFVAMGNTVVVVLEIPTAVVGFAADMVRSSHVSGNHPTMANTSVPRRTFCSLWRLPSISVLWFPTISTFSLGCSPVIRFLEYNFRKLVMRNEFSDYVFFWIKLCHCGFE